MQPSHRQRELVLTVARQLEVGPGSGGARCEAELLLAAAAAAAAVVVS